MSRWGRLIELLIVALVALLATFGLIMGYQAFCKDGCFPKPGGTAAAGPVAEVIKQQLKPCESDYRAGGCTCYPINPNVESHEYNVDFQPFKWIPDGVPPNTAIVGVRVDSAAPGAPSSGGAINDVSVYVLYPEDEYYNKTGENLTCTKEPEASGRSVYHFCSMPITRRSDYRIFITNRGTSPVSYCLTHNAGVSYH
jgi:hypothetical protein